MTVIGPLTTTFRAPSSCTTAAPQLYQIRSRDDTRLVQGPLFTSASADCFPSGYNTDTANYYSPGFCPQGYTAACSIPRTVALSASASASASSARPTETETAVACCPTEFTYSCPTGGQNQQLLGCTTIWGSRDLVNLYSVTIIADGTVSATSDLVQTGGGITAFGVQVRFRAGDPTPTPIGSSSSRITDPGFSLPTNFLPTSAPAPSGGVSTPAAIGIGVGSAVVAFLVAGAIFFYLRWRRKRRRTMSIHQTPLPTVRSDAPPAPPPKEPSIHRTIPPPYELSEEFSPRRSSKHSHSLSSTPRPQMRGDASSDAGSGVLGGGRGVSMYSRAVELEADVPSEASLRDRASPESASTGWTDRQARGGVSPMPWI